MDESVQRSFHAAIEVVAVVALVILTGILLSMTRAGYNEYYDHKNIVEESERKAEFDKYDTELSPDMTINFVVTYGEQFRYIYKSGSRLFMSLNMTERLKAAADTNDKLNGCFWDYSKEFPLISVDLIDWFRNAFATRRPDGTYGLRFALKPMTAEGEIISMKDCKSASIVLIEEVL